MLCLHLFYSYICNCVLWLPELLSNLYLNIAYTFSTRTASTSSRCELLSNLYLNIAYTLFSTRKLTICCCELLSNLYLSIAYTFYHGAHRQVLRCELLSNLYLSIAYTFGGPMTPERPELWIAFKLVSKHSIHIVLNVVAENHPVVNCFQTCI